MVTFFVVFLWWICIGSRHDFADFDPVRINEIKTAYYKVLDHNNDGIVTKKELRTGILATAQSDASFNDDSIASYIPSHYTCHPTLNFVDFADCIIIAARKDHLFKINQTDSISNKVSLKFEVLFKKYIAACSDISPFEGQFCHDIVMNSPQLCRKWSINHESFCRLSCYACDKEPYILNDAYHVRGLNNKYIPHMEQLRLSNYQMPPLTNHITANCTAVNQAQASNHSGQILFMSDIHIEPWYNVEGAGSISRFSDATIDNMWQCRNNKSEQVACSLTGEADPPLNLWQTALDFLKYHASPKDLRKDILIMGGDTQAHEYNNTNGSMHETVPRLMDKVIDDILSYFDADSVFYAAGNNDGEHDIIFCSGSDPVINTKWAHIFIISGIVTNDLDRTYSYHELTFDQISLFNKTGYYIKKIPAIFANKADSENFYAIILNTNLGISNEFQNAVFNEDLEWIQSQKGGHVLVIGHHPEIVATIVPQKYGSLVRGSFAGHVHHFVPTDRRTLFTILPATTQAAAYVAVMTANLNEEGNLLLNWDNFNQYLGENHTIPQENCWGYKGRPQ